MTQPAHRPVLYVIACGGLSVVAVPNPSTALAKHPAFLESVARLRSWGVTVLFDPEVYPLPTPNMGPASAELFPWEALADEVGAAKLHVTHATPRG